MMILAGWTGLSVGFVLGALWVWAMRSSAALADGSGGLLLRQAVQGSQAEDEIDRVDSDHAA